MSVTLSFPKDKLKLSPFSTNPQTGEPYLRLPAPHENIIITPPRYEDVDSIVKFMNDERVYSFLAGPSFPYTNEDAVRWNTSIIGRSQALFKDMEDGNQYLDGCPVQILREVLEDGTDEFIGDITIVRESPQRAWVGPEDEDNLRKPVGDPSILYSIGDYLAPTHHRRGIMSTTLRTLINEWAIPRMNCKKISATAFVGNAASIGVFKKVGFEHVGDMTKALTLPPSRGGHSMGVHLLEWACK